MYLNRSHLFVSEDKAFALHTDVQQQIDSLKQLKANNSRARLYTFNPNFIDDFKGYSLGMAPNQIDRLLAFRATGRFINSAVDFQKVTGVSDSLLTAIAPYFKFPNWRRIADKESTAGVRKEAPAAKLYDLNSVTAEELMEIKGIGEILSARIIKFRDALGGFLVADQLYDVYGLKPYVVNDLLKKYEVAQKPEVEKIQLNTATAGELSDIVYISYDLALKIVSHRTQIGGFKSFTELREIADFPTDKIDRIKLYLSL